MRIGSEGDRTGGREACHGRSTDDEEEEEEEEGRRGLGLIPFLRRDGARGELVGDLTSLARPGVGVLSEERVLFRQRGGGGDEAKANCAQLVKPNLRLPATTLGLGWALNRRFFLKKKMLFGFLLLG
jgi:hypothetical protein